MKVVDNFLTETEYNITKDLMFRSGYTLETDGHTEEEIYTGMSLDIFSDDEVYNIFSKKLKETFDEVANLNIYRMYVNCFAPLEWPYYHRDIELTECGYTCLYYLNDTWEINDGGETHFFMEDNIVAVPPIPNRVVCFDSRLLHKATSFRSRHRFTIAVKYN